MAPQRRHRRRARALTACLAACAVALGMSSEAAAVPPAIGSAPGLYLVTFDAVPTAVYSGGVRGYDATAPRDGERFDSGRDAVDRYGALLERRQDRILARVGDPDPVYRYTTVVSGVAVELDRSQVQELRTTAGVRAVERNTHSHLDSTDSASFLGLPGHDGAWAQAGGAEAAGRGVVIGVIDSGLWPDNPSFAAPSLPEDGSPPGLRGFNGSCQAGERWSADDCNQKVVAARWFVDGFGEDNVASAEYLSPRDIQGHGSHVAATAAGNASVQMTIDGESIGKTSGMAPGAAIAAYKACWAAPDPADDGCASADVLRAMDQAVADGVDIVAYPLSGQATGGTAMQLAFRNATAAGVMIVTSAGNDGHRGVSPSSPWVTTAAASTYQLFQGAAVLGNGTRLVGADISKQPVPEAPAVLGADAAAADAKRSQAALCAPGTLDAKAVADAIVVCLRGEIARVEKSRTVQRAGGVGMILLNTEPGSVEADFHAVPTVHLHRAAGARLRRYLSSAGDRARLAIDPIAEREVQVPRLAGFSGRGPADDADVLKPDLTAPGVSVLAAVAPTAGSSRSWDVLSGTSTAAAHVSGLAALIRGEHPRWSPAAVKSAMMTTAYDLVGGAGALGQGAGHVDPSQFLDPGLVYDASPPQGGAGLDARSPQAINNPSIAVSDLVGRTVVRRTVTNVSGQTETFNATVAGVPGVDVSVVPATFRLRPGQSQSFRVRFVAERSARFGRFVSGDLSWNGTHGHAVRIPLAVRARRLDAPAGRRGVGSSGSLRLAGVGGMTGRVPIDVSGLVGAVPETIGLTPGDFDPANPMAGTAAHRAVYQVGDTTAAVRFDVAARDNLDDFDLYVYRNGRLVESAAGDRSAEAVTLVDPPPGNYEVYVHLQRTADHTPGSAQVTGWVAPSRDTGTLQVPSTVQLRGGERFSVRASWSRLESSQRWFGLVSFGTGDHRQVTPVTID
ncbi:MAG TPA: S8 family serine peptidase [Nocardioidaceae bacterium]|nr:S8 family serine peptidase [Nocardioidaceae bacterium]